MRTKLLRLSLVFFFLFGLTSCNRTSDSESSETINQLKKDLAEAQKELEGFKETTQSSGNNMASSKPDDPCASDDSRSPSSEPTDEDLMIKYDCSKNDKYQHMHIDLEHQFGILSKMTFLIPFSVM